METKKFPINVITLGASGVGKTSIIKRIKDGTFEDEYNVTIGVEFFSIERDYEKKNMKYLLNFYDTNGMESMQSLIPVQYIRDSHVVLLVFSNIETLDDLKNRWVDYYKENTNIDNAKFILIGNKSDTFGNQREELLRQGSRFADEIDALFMTCSAKNADNMDNVERYIEREAKRYINECQEKKKNIKNYDKSVKLNKKKNHQNNEGKKKESSESTNAVKHFNILF